MNHPIKDISIKRFNNLIIFFNGHAWAIVARVREEKKKIGTKPLSIALDSSSLR